MIVEMASLYLDPQDAPAKNGILFKFQISADCDVTIAENTIRGGIIMEDATNPQTNLPMSFHITPEPATMMLLAIGSLTLTYRPGKK